MVGSCEALLDSFSLAEDNRTTHSALMEAFNVAVCLSIYCVLEDFILFYLYPVISSSSMFYLHHIIKSVTFTNVQNQVNAQVT